MATEGSPGPRGKCLQWADAVVPHRGFAPQYAAAHRELDSSCVRTPYFPRSLTFCVSSVLLGALLMAAGAR